MVYEEEEEEHYEVAHFSTEDHTVGKKKKTVSLHAYTAGLSLQRNRSLMPTTLFGELRRREGDREGFRRTQA
jgi:hypothetical protein